MTETEARAILAQIRSGKHFATRFQEEGWGVSASRDGTFRLWSYRDEPDGTENRLEQTLTEQQALARLMLYAYDRIRAGLR